MEDLWVFCCVGFFVFRLTASSRQVPSLVFPRLVEGYGFLSRSFSKKENGNARYNTARDLDSDASWFSACLAPQPKLWSKWRVGDHFCDPADSGLVGPHLRFASSLTIDVVWTSARTSYFGARAEAHATACGLPFFTNKN
jgi:hypothetical protein